MGKKISYTTQAYNDMKNQTDTHVNGTFVMPDANSVAQPFEICGSDVSSSITNTQGFMDKIDDYDEKRSKNIDTLYAQIAECDKKYESAFNTILETINTIDSTIATLTQCVSINTSGELKNNVSNLKRDELKNNIKDAVEKSGKDNVYELEMDYDGIKKMLDGVQDGIKAEDLINTLDDSKEAIKMFKDGIWFSVRKVNGKYIVNVKGSSISGTNKMTWNELTHFLKQNVKNVDWTKYDAKQLVRDGIDLSSAKGRKLFQDMGDTLAGQMNMDEIIKSYLEHGRLQTGLRTFKDEFLKSLNPKEYFNFAEEASKLGKATKSLGIVGDALTVVSNVVDNVDEAGGWSHISADTVQDIVTESAVDITTGAASAAAGAAIGSCFLPPVGTAVGAVAGIAIDYGANNIKLIDVDGDGEKDSLVDGIKIGVDYICDGVGGFVDSLFW